LAAEAEWNREGSMSWIGKFQLPTSLSPTLMAPSGWRLMDLKLE
jgi:hypothetical protein